jgi:hypothetical protein
VVAVKVTVKGGAEGERERAFSGMTRRCLFFCTSEYV